ncbi:glycosyltransferase family 2 protein [Hymenobacter sp. BT186]|uniref:Glycosyltransferase family 2 protein n=1 Tax=Hymenobacter telluris TaxID=2816474 RepID=A0A939EV76_9BACT|nr:glycosyltransferase family A protein [Hymenobacter telluris]MBO0358053.1 glycosyltransferase family 2 protein [Hymenobacter telluris]MBW3374080.1 glycosyltransferase family 2 protein [Hymenobacter norwichensis]
MVATPPLVSVIITCYNHGAYLSEAIVSAQHQQYPAVEIIVVDDGSTDDTSIIAAKHSGVRYIYQVNQGLSAARNTGIKQSIGSCLIFLDADDWLLPDALAYNVQYLVANPALAFVSGGYTKVFTANGHSQEEGWEVTTNHYTHLLLTNYIGMHATVMYRRWVFNELVFDSSLRGCEDYDVYLRIARRYPVSHHTRPLAAYRQHDTNMSNDIAMMLSTALTVLDRQRPHLQNAAELQAYSQGRRAWKELYSRKLYHRLLVSPKRATSTELALLTTEKPLLALLYLLHPLATMGKQLVKRHPVLLAAAAAMRQALLGLVARDRSGSSK